MITIYLFSKLQSFIRTKLSSFRNKLVFSFFILAIIPLLIIGILSYAISYNIAKDNILDSVSYSSNQLNEVLANRFTQMENASNVMQYYMYTLILQPSSSLPHQLDKYSYVKNNISNLKNTFHFFNISVYTKSDFLFSNEGITFFKIEQLDKHGVTHSHLKKDANLLHWALFKNMKEPFVVNKSTSSQNYLSTYYAFKKQTSDSIEYVYFIDINEKEISEILLNSNPDPSIKSYIINESGIIISHRNQSMLGTTIKKDLLTEIKKNKGEPLLFNNNHLIVKNNPVPKWYVVTEVPNKYVINNSRVLVNILLVTVLLVIIAMILSSIFISNNLSKKIRNMSKAMSTISFKDNANKLSALNIPVRSTKEYRDEFDNLAIVFNTMIGKINDDFDQLFEMKLHEEKMKYQLEQAKINPHFLYNILESIKTCQTLDRIGDANVMITKLAKFYRLILKKGDELISIQDELEIAILYLEMEKLNRNQSFTWTISKEDQIENFLIPKFSLQPLLENCIHHGLSGDGKNMIINISFQFESEDIMIKLSDNGVGIPPEKLTEIRHSLKNKVIDMNQFYGISNVNMRSSLYSRRNPALDIDSIENKGTIVTLSIQQMISDNDVLFD